MAHRGARGGGRRYEPILDGRSRVLAAAHADHDDGEEEEEAGHGEAHAVHGLVAHDDVTVHLVIYKGYTGSAKTETWNLTDKRNVQMSLLLRDEPSVTQLNPFKPTSWCHFFILLYVFNLRGLSPTLNLANLVLD